MPKLNPLLESDTMIGTSGLRHTTLWDNDGFVDVNLGISKNYLNETDYIIRECYFWDMK